MLYCLWLQKKRTRGDYLNWLSPFPVKNGVFCAILILVLNNILIDVWPDFGVKIRLFAAPCIVISLSIALFTVLCYPIFRRYFMGLEGFEVYTGYHQKSTHRREPAITLQATGAFRLNEAADQALGNPARMSLWFSRERKQARFRPSDGNGPSTAVRRTKTGGVIVAGTAFCHTYGIEIRTKLYQACLKEDENGKFLVIDFG